MNVPTITMDPEQAKEKLRAFRRAKHKDAEQEYAAAIKGYEQLAAGFPLISLQAAIDFAGFDEKHRPRLAIARADRKEVLYRCRGGFERRATFDGNESSMYSVAGRTSEALVREVTVPSEHNRYGTWYAMVPMVPADVRPAVGQLKDWYILWEVDQWSDRARFAPPPRDPFLLRQVHEDLYAVLAEWDLTDLERSVMAAMRRPSAN